MRSQENEGNEMREMEMNKMKMEGPNKGDGRSGCKQTLFLSTACSLVHSMLSINPIFQSLFQEKEEIELK